MNRNQTRLRIAAALVALPILGTVLTGPGAPLAALSPLAPAPASAADECAVGVMARLPGPPVAFAEMGLPADGRRYTGAGITVAIVDSGVDASRPQLSGAFARGSESLISDGERSDGLGDAQGHGTALAGIIAARPSPTSGAVGIAPDARIISLRVFRDDTQQSVDKGFGPDAGRIATAIRKATDLGARVITVALSDDVDTPALRDATNYATSRGALVVASAGNRDTTKQTEDSPRFPAAYPDALAVTAVGPTGLATASSIHGPHIDVAAPGQNVLTTSNGGGDCRYATEAPSSSFATAYAAGSAALVAQAYPKETPQQWAYRLEATADRPDPDARDDRIGWGTIRPAAALDLRPSSSTRGPVSPFADTSGAARSSATTRVTAHETRADDFTFVAALVLGAGGLIAVFALAARTRRRPGSVRSTASRDGGTEV